MEEGKLEGLDSRARFCSRSNYDTRSTGEAASANFINDV